MNTETSSPNLLTAEKLLVHLWPDAECRPSIRWLRSQQKNKTIPSIKLGHLVFFETGQVAAALEKRTRRLE